MTTGNYSDEKHSIELIRFKHSGKFYDKISFETKSNQVWQVVDEIELAVSQNKLQGNYDYMITGEGFPDTGYPALLKLSTQQIGL